MKKSKLRVAMVTVPKKIMLSSLAITLCLVLYASIAFSASLPKDWNNILKGARDEGKVVAQIPASEQLRKQIESSFETRFTDLQNE